MPNFFLTVGWTVVLYSAKICVMSFQMLLVTVSIHGSYTASLIFFFTSWTTIRSDLIGIRYTRCYGIIAGSGICHGQK